MADTDLLQVNSCLSHWEQGVRAEVWCFKHLQEKQREEQSMSQSATYHLVLVAGLWTGKQDHYKNTEPKNQTQQFSPVYLQTEMTHP